MSRMSGHRSAGVSQGRVAQGRASAPFPVFVPPCLATLADKPPAGSDWVHEVKLDGYRLQVHVVAGEVKVLTRKGEDWTSRFPSIASAAASLACSSAILDGEAVVLDPQGVSDFTMLVSDLKSGRKGRMLYYVFDLLELNGERLIKLDLQSRKARLNSLLPEPGASGVLRFSDHIPGDGAALFAKACDLGLEGIVSKRIDKPYRSGRQNDWIKVKCIQTDELVVCGYLDSTAVKLAVGALVLGYFERDDLIYAGRVGTGFTRETTRALWTALVPQRLPAPPFGARLDTAQRRGVTWVAPRLVAQVAYRGWTEDGLLRQAAFKGLREDKPARDVQRPQSLKRPT